MRKRAAALIIRDGALLLIRRQKPGRDYYILPGGGVELDESFEEACRREVEEETGFEAMGLQLVYVRHDSSTEEHYFLTRVPVGDPVLGGPEVTRISPDNQYVFTWANAEQLATLNLSPAASQRICLKILNEINQ